MGTDVIHVYRESISSGQPSHPTSQQTPTRCQKKFTAPPGPQPQPQSHMPPSRSYTAPPTFSYRDKLDQTGDDLTGRVQKSSNCYFSTGGFADIWEGVLEEKPGFKVLHFLFYILDILTGRKSQPQAQPSTPKAPTRVAVKVIRIFTYPDANGDRMTRVRCRFPIITATSPKSNPNLLESDT